ncbi:MAG: hypothetical protein V1872_11770 [bacterium]
MSPYGLHWPDLDENLSFKGLLEEDYGQFTGFPGKQRRTIHRQVR